MDVQFVAYWLNGDGTQELLHPDLPLSKVKVARDLGVGRLTATVAPEMLSVKNHSGLPVLKEWATAVYVFVDEDLFDAFIVETITDKGATVELDCVGWLGYFQGFPYMGAGFHYNYLDSKTAFRELLSHPRRAGEGADIGLVPRFYGTFPQIGVPNPDELPRIPPNKPAPPKFTEKQPVAPKRANSAERPKAPKKGNMTDAQYKKARSDYEAALKRYERDRKAAQSNYEAARKKYEKDLDAWRKRRDKAKEAERAHKEYMRERDQKIKERKRVMDDAAYKLNWWSTHDTLRELQSLMGDLGVSGSVNHTLGSDGQASHFLDLRTTQRRRLHTVEFVDGENVMERPNLARGGTAQANFVMFLGAGEGSKLLRKQSSFSAGGRHGLRRVTAVVDKSVWRADRAQRIAREQLLARREVWELGSLRVIDSALARTRTFDVGDEVLYRTLDRRGFEIEKWVVVKEISLDVDQGFMDISVAPVGSDVI